jgi:hypothetical protein
LPKYITRFGQLGRRAKQFLIWTQRLKQKHAYSYKQSQEKNNPLDEQVDRLKKKKKKECCSGVPKPQAFIGALDVGWSVLEE